MVRPTRLTTRMDGNAGCLDKQGDGKSKLDHVRDMQPFCNRFIASGTRVEDCTACSGDT